MRYADIKKSIEDERQNQTTTTNINYIKKLNNKVKIASEKTENKQYNFYFTKNGYSSVHKAW